MEEAKSNGGISEIRHSTIRERLQIRLIRAKERKQYAQDEIQECENALKMLNKNKELETIANLLQN